MITRRVTVRNKAGIHVRPAASIVKLASQFVSDFYIIKDGAEINGKSIIGVMTLVAEQGSEMDLRFEGEDEKTACDALIDLFNRGFDEPFE